jgi:Family of unknown function (DUF6163)
VFNRQTIQNNARDEIIRLGAEDNLDETHHRWSLTLVIFMRLVAVLWLAQGLVQWQIILSNTVPFDALPPMHMGMVIFFAVFNLIAAVGLWMTTPWGGVLWIIATAAHGLSTLALPAFQTGGRIVLAVDVALVLAYFVIHWYASQERGY